MKLSEEILLELLKITKPSDLVVQEALNRRDAVFAAALAYDGIEHKIESGSLAHYTPSGKLDDADGSVVMDRKQFPEYGPDGDDVGPTELIEAMAEDIRDILKENYPNLFISTGHKHAIFFRFREPIDDEYESDPTVDLVVGLDREGKPGLWIPNLQKNNWEPSDPEAHTRMVLKLRAQTNGNSSKVTRLGKLFTKQWTEVPLLSSFHVTALVMESFSPGTSVLEGFIGMLQHGGKELKYRNTPDPAGVSDDLKIPTGRDRDKLVRKLTNASDNLQKIIELETENDENYDEILDRLKKVFWSKQNQELINDIAGKVKIDRTISYTQGLSLVSGTLMSEVTGRPIPNTRSFGVASVNKIAPALPSTSDILDTPDKLKMFELGLTGSGYGLLYSKHEDNQHRYLITVPVPAYKRSMIVRILISNGYIKVFAGELHDPKHVYPGEGNLCMWYPHDPEERSWKVEHGIVRLLDIAQQHLFKELRYKETGRWPGEEVH